jgi:hypothetical protein
VEALARLPGLLADFADLDGAHARQFVEGVEAAVGVDLTAYGPREGPLVQITGVSMGRRLQGDGQAHVAVDYQITSADDVSALVTAPEYTSAVAAAVNEAGSAIGELDADHFTAVCA